MIRNVHAMRRLSKIEIRDYARTLVPILEAHDIDGTRDLRIVDAIISYAMKGTRSWMRRGSALQGFIGPRMSVLEGYLIFPTPGIGEVGISTSTLENSYLLIDIIGAGGGGGGGGGGNTTATTPSGQGGGGGAEGARLIVRTQGPLTAGTVLIPQLGGPGGTGGRVGSPGSPGSTPDNTQVLLGNYTITLNTGGSSPPPMPPTTGGQEAGGIGGGGGSAIFGYLPTTPIFSVIQLGARFTLLANNPAILDQGIGGDGVGSEYFSLSNSTPIFVSTPQGTRVAGGNPGTAGTSATANVPTGAIPLRGSGAGGGGGANSATAPGTGGNGGAGGPGPIIILVIG